jgi:hypothetical protein
MNPVKTVSGAVTRPVHTAATVAGRAIGLSIGATKLGVRTTGRVVGWAADRGMAASADLTGATPDSTRPETSETSGTSVTVPGSVPGSASGTAGGPTAESTEKASASTERAASVDGPEASSVPTPAEVKPAIDRSAPLEAEPVDEVLTASGIPAADVGVNPATGEPHDYDTEGEEPLLDPATVKSVRSETEVLRRASDSEKG